MIEFTPCTHPDIPGQVASIPTLALPTWQALGWEPCGESLTPTQAQDAAVEAEQAPAVVVADLTVPEVLEKVGDDPELAAAALEAELAADNPRTTLVAGLTQKAGQPGDPEGN